jgi:hypothetical protein
MLFTSLAFSSILLLLSWWAVHRSRHPVSVVFLCGLGMMGGLFCLAFFSPVFALQAALLTVLAAVWRIPRRRTRPFLPVALAVSAAAYVLVGWFAYQDCRRLREQFPYVSLEGRLPRQPTPAGGPLPERTRKGLGDFEARLSGDRHERWYASYRLWYLEQMHEHMVEVFISRPGFGVGRMSGLPEYALQEGERARPPLPQPGPRLPPSSLGLLNAQSPRRETDSFYPLLLGMHLGGVADFANPGGFGFVKDRAHVAGFQPHRFDDVPSLSEEWKLQTLDLVGLVVHADPVAYVSDNLPRMDELRSAPTRSLDDFEAAGLVELRRGEDLYVRDGTDARRMLGAVRGVKQCLPCHGGERGDLLGAFSYTFRRAPQ